MKIVMVVEEIDKEPCILIDSPYIKSANFKSGDILNVDIRWNKIVVSKKKKLKKKDHPMCRTQILENLYNVLFWYIYEASEEEFYSEKVDAIVKLLDILDPPKE